ncbi:GNAT family N-acetyltransferase [Sinomicrobium sp. M5D2P17]
MVIRKGKKEDSEVIAAYIMLAMEDITYNIIGERNAEKATGFLENLAGRKGNQYSYENCWIAEDAGEITGAAIVYDGALLDVLQKPVADEVKLRFGRDLTMEKETQPGEFYIDCIGVNPAMQGKGIGSGILEFLIAEYVLKQGQVLGLLVDKDNPKAKKLYLKMGFAVVGEKTLSGKRMEHLQCVR